MSAFTVGSRVRRGKDKGTVTWSDMQWEPVLCVKWDGSGEDDYHAPYRATELQIIVADAGQEAKKEVAEEAEMLQKDIGRLLGSKETSDFTVVCGDEEMPCHRAILWARSAAFRTGVVSDLAEGTANRWTIEGAEPAAVRLMLDYITPARRPLRAWRARPGGCWTSPPCMSCRAWPPSAGGASSTASAWTTLSAPWS
jgi:hypothetical protein